MQAPMLLQATTAVAAPATGPFAYVLGGSEIFTLLFIMLGPLKLLGAYAHATATLPVPQMRSLAWKAAVFATVSIVVGGFLGASLMANWKVDPRILELTAGLVFLLVALQMVMQPYAAVPHAPTAAEPPGLVRIVFPMLLTPYGIAAVILLLSLSQDRARTLLVIGIVIAMMALDLLGMLFARRIMHMAALPLQVLGAVLSVLQAALALQIIYTALRGLGVV